LDVSSSIGQVSLKASGDKADQQLARAITYLIVCFWFVSIKLNLGWKKIHN